MLIPVRVDRTTKPPMGTPLRSDGHWSVQGLVAFPLNEGGGSSVFNSNGNIGTVRSNGSGKLTANGWENNETYNDSHVYFASSVCNFYNSITILQSVNVAYTSGPYGCVLLSKGESAQDTGYFTQISYEGKFLLYTGNVGINGIYTVELNKDTVVGGVIKGTNGVTYINGQVDNSSTSLSLVGTNYDLIIGSYNAATFLALKGIIYWTLVYNTALSSQQISSLSKNPWQIYEPETVWIEVGGGGGTAHALTAAILAGSTTSTANAQMIRTLLANLSGSSATSTAAVAIIRGLVAAISGSSTSNTVTASIVRGLIANLTASSSTSASLITLSRSLVAAISGSSTTPTVTATITGLINLVASISGASATPASVIATTARLLIAALSGSSATPTVTASMSGLINLIAALSASSSTGSVLPTLQRNMQAAMAGSSTTPSITGSLANILNLVAALSATSNTSTILATLQRELMAAVSVASNTGAISITTARSLQAVLSAQSLTSDNVGMVLGVLGTIINTSIESATIIRAIESITKKYTIH